MGGVLSKKPIFRIPRDLVKQPLKTWLRTSWIDLANVAEVIPCHMLNGRPSKPREMTGNIIKISKHFIKISTTHTLKQDAAVIVQFVDPFEKIKVIVATKVVGLSPTQSLFHAFRNLPPFNTHTSHSNGENFEYCLEISKKKKSDQGYKHYLTRVKSDAYLARLVRPKRKSLGRYIGDAVRIICILVLSPIQFSRYWLLARSIKFKIAETKAEKEAVYRLVYEEYLRQGYLEKNAFGMFTYLYQILPRTTSVIGVLKGEVVATMGVLEDTVFKLPMDYAFGDLLNKLRQNKSNRIVESSMTATRHDLFGKDHSMTHVAKMWLVCSLFRFGLQYAHRVQKATHLLVAVPPRFKKLYRFVCGEQMGPTRFYGKYKTPAVPFYYDFTKNYDPTYMKKIGRPSHYQFFCKTLIPYAQLKTAPPLTTSDMQYLFLEKSDLLKRITPEQIRLLEKHYPKQAKQIAKAMLQSSPQRKATLVDKS